MSTAPEGASSLPIRPNSERVAGSASVASWMRLVLAMLGSLFLLYPWAYSLVVYSRWGQIDRRFLYQLIGGLVVVIALNFNLAKRFASRRTAIRALVTVFSLWTIIAVALIVIRNGDLLPAWLVFAGFYPATLWVVWAAWIFFLPMRATIRFGVLVLLLLAVFPFIHFFEANDLTGDTRVNFALRQSVKPDALVKSTVGELTSGGVKLVADPKTDFPSFQGPAATAVLPQANLARDWKSHPPRELWRIPVGAGWGGFSVVGDLAFTQEQRANDECVVCRDVKTGHEIWVHSDQAPYNDKPRYEGMGGPGPRCTPTIHEGRVYTVGATGIFNCLDGATGHAIWKHNIVTENGGSVAFHGVCGSPIIVGHLVIVSPTGKPEISLAAYDRLTGQPAWHSGIDEASYATPMLATVDGVTQILNYTSHGVTAHDPANGKVLWHYDWTNNEGVVCSQPIADAGAPNQVLLTVGYGKGSVLLKVNRGADGKWTTNPIWQNRHMKTKFMTAVLDNGYVYGLDDGIMQCLDVKTGKPMWKRGRYEHGQILLAGDVILVQTEQPGSVVLIEPNPKSLVELGTIPALSSKTWNCLALAGKHLLVRNDREAACYEVALDGESPRTAAPTAIH